MTNTGYRKWAGCECFVECCTRPVKTVWLCSVHYQRVYFNGVFDISRLAVGNGLVDSYESLCSLTSLRNDTGCREWGGTLNSSGYGSLSFDGKAEGVHRIALLLSGVTIPAGHEVDHICKNRKCVEVAHLRVVTPSENAQRIWISSRSTSGHRGVSWHKPSGSWRVRVKLDGKERYIGLFPEYELHVAAYKARKARSKLFTMLEEGTAV